MDDKSKVFILTILLILSVFFAVTFRLDRDHYKERAYAAEECIRDSIDPVKDAASFIIDFLLEANNELENKYPSYKSIATSGYNACVDALGCLNSGITTLDGYKAK